MLAFLVLSGILSEASLRGIEVERSLPQEIFAGRPNPVVLRIRNRQARVAAFAITVEDRLAGEDARPLATGRCFALRIGPGARVERRYAWTPSARGDHRFTSARVSTRFPFALFVKSLELDLEQAVLVYPALEPIPLRGAVPAAARDAAADPAGRAPVGDSLAGLREYATGDAAARIHWRRSLRSGRLVVGEREGETAGEIEVLLVLPSTLARPSIEHRISRAASEIVRHLDAGHAVGLSSPIRRFAPGRGAAHRHALLAFLARLEPDPSAGFPARRAGRSSDSAPGANPYAGGAA